MAEPTYPLLQTARLRMDIDGEGVTTLVAGAGCPLKCRWCINRRFLSEGRAESVTARELYDRVKIDDLYFRATGGGVTFGGGEALIHSAFIREFRGLCEGWRIYAETSLAVPRENVAAAAEAVDGFIVDIKDMDAEIYRLYTGGDAALMLGNLEFLLSAVGPGRIHVRVPLIPEFNTPEDRVKSVSLLRAMGITKIETFDYIIRNQ